MLSHRTLISVILFLSITWPFCIVLKIGALPRITPDRITIIFSIILLAYTMSSNFDFKKIRKYRFYVYILALMSIWWSITSFMAALSPIRSLSITLDWIFSCFFFSIYILYFIKDEQQVVQLLKVFVYSIAIVNIFGIAELYTHQNFLKNFTLSMTEDIIASFTDKTRELNYRIQSVFNHPLVYAQVLVSSIPAHVYFLLQGKTMKKRVLGILNLIFIYFLIYHTHSRAGISLALLVPVIMLGYYMYSKKTKTIRLLFLLVNVFIIVSVLSFMDNFHDVVQQSYEIDSMYKHALINEVETSTLSRVRQIVVGYEMFQKQPLFGYGAGNSRAVLAQGGFDHIDNYYLSILLEKGLVGLFIMLVFSLYILFLVKRFLQKEMDLLMIVLITSFIVILLFYSILSIYKADVLLFMLASLILVKVKITEGCNSDIDMLRGQDVSQEK